MANQNAARVTGIVLKTEERSGSKKQDDGTYKPWVMRSVRVLVGGEDICDVGFSDRLPMPGKGEAVDLLVSIRQSGNYLNIDAVGEWTERHTDASVA